MSLGRGLSWSAPRDGMKAAHRNLVREVERVNSFTIAAWLGRRAKLTGFGAFRGTRFDRRSARLFGAASGR